MFSKSTLNFDAIVLGAGAAGLMCAIEAGRRGRRVAVLDHADKPGKKILISGGGRCNFTNLECRPERFLSANPHFAKSALALYTADDFVAMVEKHGISYHEKTLGQLFCDRSAQDILTMLLTECRESGVEIFLKQQGIAVSQTTDNETAEFVVATATHEFHAAAVVVATGGLSIPKMGATALGYDIARQFGLRIEETYPGLVPLLFNEDDRDGLCDLAGVSTEVTAATAGGSFREKMLITHRGLSGPAILQISSYWKQPAEILLDLAPDRMVMEQLLASAAGRDQGSAAAALRTALPARLAERLLELAPPERWTNHALQEYEHRLHHWPFTPAGTEGYEKAEVTAGGVDTAELSAKTMESRRVRGLYFIGEVVDVTGHLGGYNFQWAWSSGAAAGRAL